MTLRLSSRDYQQETHFVNKEYRFTLVLRIDNFIYLRNKSDEIRSDCIRMNDLGLPQYADASWALLLFPNGPGHEDSTFVSVVLECFEASAEAVPVQACVNIRVLDDLGRNLITVTRGDFPVEVSGASSAFRRADGLGGFISHTDLFLDGDIFLPNGTLIVKADVRFVLPLVKVDALGIPWNPLSFQDNCLSQLLESYLASSDTDFTLVSSDFQEFKVHQFILKARSPVFEAMLTDAYGTMELRTGKCSIPDVDGETLDLLLKFMYGCRFNEIGPIVQKIVVAAEKYQIPELSQVSVQRLIWTLDAKNAGRYLVLADTHRLVALKEAVLSFIDKNLGDFVDHGGLQTLFESQIDGDLHEDVQRTVARFLAGTGFVKFG